MKKILLAIGVSLITQSCLYEKNESSSNINPSDNTTGIITNGSDTTSSNISCGSSSSAVSNNSGICFNTQILPFFQTNCAQSGCHDARTKAEGYDLSSYSGILKKGISVSNPSSSKLYKVMIDTGSERMPPSPASKLSKTQTDLILTWIKEGAKQTNCNVVINAENATFNAVIKPFLDVNCVGCHQSGNASGNILLSSYANVKLVADNGRLLGSIKHSPGYSAMPPARLVSSCEITAVSNWISKGAKND